MSLATRRIVRRLKEIAEKSVNGNNLAMVPVDISVEAVAREAGVHRATVYALRNALSTCLILPKLYGSTFIVGYQVDAQEYAVPLVLAYDYLTHFSTLQPATKSSYVRQLLYEAAAIKTVVDFIGRTKIPESIEYKTKLEGELNYRLGRVKKSARFAKSAECRKILSNLLGRKNDPAKLRKPNQLATIKNKEELIDSPYRSKLAGFSQFSDNFNDSCDLPAKIPYRRRKMLEKPRVSPKTASPDSLGNYSLERIFKQLVRAHLTTFTNSRFNYGWDGNLPLGIVRGLKTLNEWMLEDGLLSIYEPLRAAFAYYKLIYNDKAPPQRCLGGEQFLNIVQTMIIAHRQWKAWLDRLDSSAEEDRKKFDDWLGIVQNVAKANGFTTNPLDAGGSALSKFNRWILLKAWVDYFEIADRLDERLNLKMSPNNYLTANFMHIKRKKRRSFEDLCGYEAKERAYAYTRVNEDRNYVDPSRVTSEFNPEYDAGDTMGKIQ